MPKPRRKRYAASQRLQSKAEASRLNSLRPQWINGDAGTTRLNVAFTEPLALNAAPAFADFSCQVNGVNRGVNAAAIASAQTLSLTLASALTLNDFVSVTFNGATPIEVAGGGPAVLPFTATGVISQA